MNGKIFNLEELFRSGKERLREAQIEEADLDAWYLLEYITGVTKTAYYGNPKADVPEEQAEEYEVALAKRAEHIPLQHITGRRYFMGYEFLVNDQVLVPRQDTENLVEEAYRHIKEKLKKEPNKKVQVLDVCTGSGCILLSLMKLCGQIEGTGVDISEGALEVARQNGERLKADAVFRKSDLFENVEGAYDIIVSNPPYIRSAVIEELADEVKLHDPYIALDGKEDGLYFYRKIIAQAGKYLKPGGWILFEIGHDQAEEVSALLAQAGYDKIDVKKDLAGLDRVVSAMYNKG